MQLPNTLNRPELWLFKREVMKRGQGMCGMFKAFKLTFLHIKRSQTYILTSIVPNGENSILTIYIYIYTYQHTSQLRTYIDPVLPLPKQGLLLSSKMTILLLLFISFQKRNCLEKGKIVKFYVNIKIYNFSLDMRAKGQDLKCLAHFPPLFSFPSLLFQHEWGPAFIFLSFFLFLSFFFSLSYISLFSLPTHV